MSDQKISIKSWNKVVPANARSGEPRVARIREEMGAWVSRARAEAGLKRREVAERMGYVSLDRGAARLAQWERGEDGVWGDRIPLLAVALGVSAEELGSFALRENEEVRRARERDRRCGEADGKAYKAECLLLAQHTGALLGRARSEPELEALPDIPLLAAGCSIMMMCGGGFTLRTLLSAWLKGHFTKVCDCCGGPLRLYWVAGSPFSGAHQIRGICEKTGQVRGYRMSEGESLMQLVDPVIALRKEGYARSRRNDLTLAEVLGILGLDTPQVRIKDAKGEAIAFFDPGKGTIASVEVEEQDAPKEHGLSELTAQVSEQRGPARVGGRVVIGSIDPLFFGERRGDLTRLFEEDGREWRLYPGYLEGPDGEPVAFFDAPVPPSVAGWVVARILSSAALDPDTDAKGRSEPR